MGYLPEREVRAPMTIFAIATSFANRRFQSTTVTEAEVAFLFVDGASSGSFS